MTEEERKEYTVDDLFRFKTTKEITVHGREVKVVFKTLGDGDAKRRKLMGTKASSDALRDIDNPESLLYAERIVPLHEMSDDELAIALRSVKQAEFYNDAVQDILPEPPDDDYEGLSGLAEREEYLESETRRVEKEREEYSAKAAKEYVDLVRDNADFREIALGEIVPFVREVAAREAMQMAWVDATIHFSTWVPDESRHWYESIEMWRNADPEFKGACFREYIELDKATKDPNF